MKGKRDRDRHGWSVGVIVGIAGLVVGVGAAIGIPVKVFWDLKSNGAYRQGMEIARKDPAVIEMFGEPVKGGFFVVGTIKGFGYGPRVASLDVSISGPRAHGILYVLGREREDHLWRVTGMSIDIGGKQVLVWEEEQPEKGFHQHSHAAQQRAEPGEPKRRMEPRRLARCYVAVPFGDEGRIR